MLKKIIWKIDEVFLAKRLQKRYSKFLNDDALSVLDADSNYKIVSHYQKNKYCELSRLCDLYGSDKGELRNDGHPYPWPSHTYADFYSRLFSHCRSNVKNVFECGLGTNNPNLISSMGIAGKPGASLRVWRDFFPNSTVYGADIDKDVLFEEDRIKTFYIDQLDPETIKKFWNNIEVNDFDFMLDDGLHTFEGGSTLFIHSIEKLSPTGIYIIEDVYPADLLRYQQFFSQKNYIVEYVCLSRPDKIELADNNLVVIRKK
jgi:hypothetical protein